MPPNVSTLLRVAVSGKRAAIPPIHRLRPALDAREPLRCRGGHQDQADVTVTKELSPPDASAVSAVSDKCLSIQMPLNNAEMASKVPAGAARNRRWSAFIPATTPCRRQQNTWGLTQFGRDHAKADLQTKIASARKLNDIGEAKGEAPRSCNDVGRRTLDFARRNTCDPVGQTGR
jgi:hypothetical protein